MIISKDDKRLDEIKNRNESSDSKYDETVKTILNDVKLQGDEALFSYTAKFDRLNLSSDTVRVTDKEIDDAVATVDKEFTEALSRARDNILLFHSYQIEKSWNIETSKGSILGQRVTPLERVGIYVPGGKASYFSSVLMNALPAKVAGVKEIAMVTPAVDGYINPKVLLAARVAGVTEIYKVGGAQAIGALAYGTESIKKVDKIVGPGNIYVALAKKSVFGLVDIDMIAGPSEILIIADEHADPCKVAADMLSQAEHDELAASVTITNCKLLAEKVVTELKRQLELLPRKDIAQKSLDNYGAIVVVDTLIEAAEISNSFAPEHLELYIKSPMEFLPNIKHAGAIFMGEYSPEVIGDYYAGPNHVLPTGGSARFFSPLGTYDFIKRSSTICYSKEELNFASKDVIRLASDEGLDGHANSIIYRQNK